MTLQGGAGGFEPANDEQLRDEHPSVVLRDLDARRRPQGHVIAFANEKGGVGKSTLAFHCAVALAHRGMNVLAVDCDRRQQSLHRHLEARDGTARALRIPLPRPGHVVLDRQSGALLVQEIARLGHGCDFVIIDIAGQDSPVARRAVAMADTVVTPINCSPTDLDALGRINAVTRRFMQAGPFAEIVTALRAERTAQGQAGFDWIVAKNRVRHCEQRLIATVDANLATISRHLGFRTIAGLTERVAYRELLSFGLTQLDLRLIPDLGAARSGNLRELRALVEDLQLPCPQARRRRTSAPPAVAAVPAQTRRNYREAIADQAPARARAV